MEIRSLDAPWEEDEELLPWEGWTVHIVERQWKTTLTLLYRYEYEIKWYVGISADDTKIVEYYMSGLPIVPLLPPRVRCALTRLQDHWREYWRYHMSELYDAAINGG